MVFAMKGDCVLSIRTFFALVCSVVLAGLVAPPVVLAQGMDPTVVVLDASGSMMETDVGGVSRMDAAKQAVGEFVDQVPATDGLWIRFLQLMVWGW